MAASEEAKLERFLQWLQANGVELRGCSIKYCGLDKGFGVFSTASGDCSNGVLMVVPLDLAITPMRVLQDPILGQRCRAMFEEGDVDDRFLMMLFLIVERLRSNSPWKPYLDMLPSSFGNPLWFTEDELAELRGTTLYRATVLQRKKLQALYDDKVKGLVEELLHPHGKFEGGSEVRFEDFLWANSIFWTRALNIPFPHSYVFPKLLGEQNNNSLCHKNELGTPTTQNSDKIVDHGKGEKSEDTNIVGEKEKDDETSNSKGGETVWVEGLVPGIDFCNHGLKAVTTWEVDQRGNITGVPFSMHLISADQSTIEVDKEILISYGNKGNEELLYLYGFVIDDNPDDYLMVHYPMEAIQNLPFGDCKERLLEIQKAELRCLLPRSLLDHGFFSKHPFLNEDRKNSSIGQVCNYSWSGQRKVPPYLNDLVFPQDFLTALRTIAMQEHELSQVSKLLEELVGSGEERQPSDREVQAAVWEACGDSGALQLLVDLLSTKMMELEEGSGTEACDAKLLEEVHVMANRDEHLSSPKKQETTHGKRLISKNQWSSIVYRSGQKQLTHLFLKEAERALELCGDS